MKTLILALNSKYIHASLAPWYLKSSCQDDLHEVKVLECTINDNMEHILGLIYDEKPDNLAFSCYIWNMDKVLKLCKNMKSLSPQLQIVIGGPEVSYDGEDILKSFDFIDYVICGEGEYAFSELLKNINKKSMDLDYINGLCFRKNGKIITNGGFNIIENLDDIKSPYTDEMLKATKGKIIYFESSRGCPFSCSYCLSSTTNGVRFLSLDIVKERLTFLVDKGYHQIKFVDRTFNCDKKRAEKIFEFIINTFGKNNNINFHFEAAADLFSPELLSLLAKAPKGLIQLEIGIQTLNIESLKEIKRVSDINTLMENIKCLLALRNIHIHVDLIAGLPYDDLKSFKDSFNTVYNCKADNLQLGFLKLLKGSQIRREASKHGYVYRDYIPYEILKNNYMTFEDIQFLKGIDELVDRFYNSKRFLYSLDYIIDNYYDNPIDFFGDFHKYCRETGYFGRSISSRESYTLFKKFCESTHNINGHILNELLKFDYLASDCSVNLPEGLLRYNENGFMQKCHDFLKVYENIDKYLPQYKDMPVKSIIKKVHFEIFEVDVIGKLTDKDERAIILFDYSEKDKVAQRYKSYKIEF